MSKKILGMSVTTAAIVAGIGYLLYKKSKPAAPVNGLGYMPDTYLSFGPVNGMLDVSFLDDDEDSTIVEEGDLSGFGSFVKRLASHSPAVKLTKATVKVVKKPTDKVLKSTSRVPLVGKAALPLVALGPAVLKVAGSSKHKVAPKKVRAGARNEYYDANNKRISEVEYNRQMVDYSRGVSYSDTQVPLNQQGASTVSASGGNTDYGYGEDIQPEASSDQATERFDAAPSGTEVTSESDTTDAAAPAAGGKGMMAVAAAAAGAFFLFKH